MNHSATQAAIDAAFELFGAVEDRMAPPDASSPDYYHQLIVQRVTCGAVALIAVAILAEHWAGNREPGST